MKDEGRRRTAEGGRMKDEGRRRTAEGGSKKAEGTRVKREQKAEGRRRKAEGRVLFTLPTVPRTALCVLLSVIVLLVLGTPARAQAPLPPMLREVGFDQRLDQPLPLELTFRDESGRSVTLADYFGSKPIILTLNYYHCRNLCPLELDELVGSFADLSLTIGEQFDVITLSIDPRDTPKIAADKKNLYLRRYARPGANEGWHFLTGDASSIQTLASAVGFRYAYDPAQDEYAHPLGVIVLTPQGKIARYLNGLDFPAQDLRLALVEASQNRIGSAIDQLLLLCYHYDPATGKYSALALDLTRLGGIVTAVGLAAFLFLMWRREAKVR